jgi:DNA repair exonuclease SbcCD ATPase subunit
VRITEFLIQRYPPLAGREPVRPGTFSLLYAPNEEGKTLTAEALVRMLLGRDVRQFKGIKRVDEEPVGYVALRWEDGTRKRLPDDGHLPDLTDLRSEDCRNIFVVRNSDLSLAGEPAFYTDVADRLTGLQTEEVQAIADKLRQIGHLTPTGRISDAEEHDKIGSRLEQAAELVEEVDRLTEQIQATELDRCEERLGEIRERLNTIQDELDRQEEARMRTRYEKCSAALAALREETDELGLLDDFTDQDEQAWHDARKRIKEARAERERLTSEADKLQQDTTEQAARLKEKQRKLEVLDRRAEKLSGIRQAITDYRESHGAAPTDSQIAARKLGTAVFGLLTAVCLVGLILTRHWAFWVLGAPFGLVCAMVAVSLFQQTTSARDARHRLNRIREWAADAGMAVADLSEALAAVRKLEDAHGALRKEVNEEETSLRVRRKRAEELSEERVPELDRTIRRAEETIRRICMKSGAESLEDYRMSLHRKNSLQAGVQSHSAVLENQLGKTSEGLPENTAAWEAKLREMAAYREQAPDVAYSEEAIQELRGERDRLQKEQRSLRQSVEELRDDLRRIEHEASEVLGTEADLTCSTSDDLPAVRERLRRFVEQNEANIETARAAIAVFEQITREEEEKVAELFGADSRVSKLFGEITGGLYRSVDYVHEDNKRRVVVTGAGGWSMDADGLSGGAYDQLYLAVRLALGQALLGGESGFFIMDDPFVKADPTRLRRQLNILLRIAERGWQILYFTAKGEVREALAEDIREGKVRELSLPGLRRSDAGAAED